MMIWCVDGGAIFDCCCCCCCCCCVEIVCSFAFIAVGAVVAGGGGGGVVFIIVLFPIITTLFRVPENEDLSPPRWSPLPPSTVPPTIPLLLLLPTARWNINPARLINDVGVADGVVVVVVEDDDIVVGPPCGCTGGDPIEIDNGPMPPLFDESCCCRCCLFNDCECCCCCCCCC